MLKAAVLIDNIPDGELAAEWGLSIHISYRGKNYLLDTGKSEQYAQNAEKLGISLEDVDCAVLSHAHYDHSGGYGVFFEKNSKAPLYVSGFCGEDCYFKYGWVRRYIGVPENLFSEHEDRIRRVSGFCQLDDGVWLVSHLENRLEKIGKRAHLYRKVEKKMIPDDFSHEQSLVFETDRGLAVFNSCSHGGLQNILNDIRHFLPEKSIYMTVGGLHLSKYSKREVRKIAKMIGSLGISRVITGHCTGEKAFEILKQELGDSVEQTCSGCEITV